LIWVTQAMADRRKPNCPDEKREPQLAASENKAGRSGESPANPKTRSGAMEKEYVVIVRFDNKSDADVFVESLDIEGFEGSYSSAEPYKPYHYIADVLEVAVLKVKAFFRGV